MLGILFKLATAAFPFLREMLFSRSANGRTKMISFLIICNIALAISFFTTAKLTATLYIKESAHKEEIKQLKIDLTASQDALKLRKGTESAVADYG